MGWWRIDDPESGGIGCVPKDGGLANAQPGEDSAVELYNGDGPADIVGPAVDSVINQVSKTPTRDDVHRLFLHQELQGVFRQIPKDRVSRTLEVVRVAMEKLDREYQRAWGRSPYPMEKQAALNFVLNPIVND